MDLRFGSGDAEALLDMTTQRVVMVNDPETLGKFAEQQGGRLYYQSRSGLSGAGWVPNRLTLRPCGVLRTDVARPSIPTAEETLPSLRIIVPTQHLRRDESAPLIVVQRHQQERPRVFLLAEHQLPSLLRGELPEGGGREVELTSWVSSGSGRLYERKLVVDVVARWPWPKRAIGFRRMLELVFWDELYDGAAEDRSEEHQNGWRKPLGLALGADGRLYRAAGGILREPVRVTKPALQAAAPWVFFFEDLLCYLAEAESGFWVHSPVFGSVAVSTPEALQIVSSGVMPDQVAERLNDGCSLQPGWKMPGWIPRIEEDGDLSLSAWERELLAAERDAGIENV